MSGEATSLVELLERAARSAEGVRFVEADESETFYSYAEIRERAGAVAAGLAALGIEPGARVALVLPTGVGFYDAFFGALLAGAVPVPLYPPVRLGRLDEYHERTAAMLDAASVRLLVTDRRIGRLLGRTVRRTRRAVRAVHVDALAATPAPAPPRPGPADLAFIQFSSGTTAAPRPIRLTHGAVLANVRAILGALLDAFPESGGLVHRGVSWLPLYHDMGLVSVLTAMARPGELVLLAPERFVARPALWLRALSRHRATVSAAPNFAFAFAAERVRDDELEGVDLGCWRLALNGAEPVTARAIERFVERFRPFGLRDEAVTPVYGLAEATLAVTFSDPHRRFRSVSFDRERLAGEGIAVPAAGRRAETLVSVGRPLPGFAVSIRDETGRELAAGRLGRVWVRGPSLMDGYEGRPEETARVLRDGWLDTGDVGFVHDGELFLYARAKDVVIVRGRNYAPSDIEQAVEGLADVRPGGVAAVGLVGEDELAEQLVLFVEHRRGTPPERRDALARAARRRVVERVGLPARVVVLEPGTLPRTSSGKIRRDETRRRFLAGTLRPPAPVTTLRVLGEIVRSAVAFAAVAATRSRGEEP